MKFFDLLTRIDLVKDNADITVFNKVLQNIVFSSFDKFTDMARKVKVLDYNTTSIEVRNLHKLVKDSEKIRDINYLEVRRIPIPVYTGSTGDLYKGLTLTSEAISKTNAVIIPILKELDLFVSRVMTDTDYENLEYFDILDEENKNIVYTLSSCLDGKATNQVQSIGNLYSNMNSVIKTFETACYSEVSPIWIGEVKVLVDDIYKKVKYIEKDIKNNKDTKKTPKQLANLSRTLLLCGEYVSLSVSVYHLHVKQLESSRYTVERLLQYKKGR